MAWQCKVWFVHSSSCIQYLGWGCVLCIITLWLPRSAGTLLEGLLLRAGSGAAIPYTSRDFPVPAGCVTEMLNVYDVLPKLDLTVSLLQVLLAQQSSKTSAFLCLSALDESTRKSWPCSSFPSCGDLAVLQVYRGVWIRNLTKWDKRICNLKLELWGGYEGSSPSWNQWILAVNHSCIALSSLELVIWSAPEMTLGPDWAKISGYLVHVELLLYNESLNICWGGENWMLEFTMK